MIVTAWHNGQDPEKDTSYGLKVHDDDIKRFFKREWRVVTLELEGASRPVEVNIDKPSFWDGVCGQLVKKEIGKWLRQAGLTKWPRGAPPKLEMTPMSENRFFVHRKNLRS